MADDLVQRAHLGDLSGQNWAGLTRLSFETEEKPLTTGGSVPDAASGQRQFHPLTGRDIKSRDEQEKDNRRYVESRGGTYVHTYEEPDTSAWKRKRVRLPDGRVTYRVIRPVFEGALNDLKAGRTPDGVRMDGLIVSDVDRLTRDNRHLEDAIEVVENFRHPIIDITGTLDLLTDNGRTVARILVATSNKQSADTARRVTRKHRAMEQAGIPTGSRRPFGWQDDKRSLNPLEAKAIRAATKRLLAGASLRSIVADWNGQGLTSTLGNKWKPQTLKQVLRNPRLCGYRSRHVSEFDPATRAENRRMEIVTDDASGEPVKGTWTPILSVRDWRAVVELIGAAQMRGDGNNARKYLCTGTLRCGKTDCNAYLRGSKAPASRAKPEGFFYYTCPPKNSSGGGCGGVRISGPETDALVAKMVIAKYEEEAASREAQQAPGVWDKEDQLARIREDIAEWTQARADRQVTKDRFFEFLGKAEAIERRLNRERAAFQRKQADLRGKPVDLRATWKKLEFIDQRTYVERALTAVIVAPAVGRNQPLRNRLTPIPREED
jgi:DNA invertase Pin-like site-specific DNA recombinase